MSEQENCEDRRRKQIEVRRSVNIAAQQIQIYFAVLSQYDLPFVHSLSDALSDALASTNSKKSKTSDSTSVIRADTIDFTKPLSPATAEALDPWVYAHVNSRISSLREELKERYGKKKERSERGRYTKRNGESDLDYKLRKEANKDSRHISQFRDKLVIALLDPSRHVVFNLGSTTQADVDAASQGANKKDVLLFYLNGSLVCAHLSGDLGFPQVFRERYDTSQLNLIDSYNGKLPQPRKDKSSHSNQYPERVGLSGIFDNSLGFMAGHHNDLETELKIREDRCKASWKLTESFKYLKETEFATKIVDAVIGVLFLGSLERKMEIKELLHSHEKGCVALLESNGGYLLRNVSCVEHLQQGTS
ncbi:hypothetical protein BCR33DRAFT_772707 [Rhizoclosmatium globosum]|uniref:Uncharacterized protein n=1 Tax=Rhizoclosmatium globosum TaxID=329046 RepID=A0A1Y2B1M2_9FUNG|nr:hypothetical protein BCR33DRAFT_772707 [Rhizoclosmatium globosum]|eukprot:ORY28731.1 hypothetical protein BCR33DRAFT_772707 [Rhizoclosmatium globosum]